MNPSIRRRLLELWNLDLYRLPPDTQHRLRRIVKVTMLPFALLLSARCCSPRSFLCFRIPMRAGG